VPTYHPNAAGVEGAEVVTLRPAEQRDGVDIRVLRSPSFCVDAVLVGASARTRFEISETQPASGRVGEGGFYTSAPGGLAGADGKLRSCDLAAGDYQLSASEANVGAFERRTQFASTVLTLRDRDVAGIQLVMRPKLPVTGEVAWDGPAPDPPLTTKLDLSVEA